MKNHFGSLDNLRGKKIAMTWAYSPSYGKPLSVPQGVIGLMTRFGMDVVLAHPEGYQLIPDVVAKAGVFAKENGGSFKVVNSMDEAFAGADVVYPKSWAPYHVMEKRTELLRGNDTAGLKELEKACLAKNAEFKDWECTEAKMKLTREGKALYMHCLPADISGVSCAAGEVAAERVRALPHPHLHPGGLQALHYRRRHAGRSFPGPGQAAEGAEAPGRSAGRAVSAAAVACGRRGPVRCLPSTGSRVERMAGFHFFIDKIGDII